MISIFLFIIIFLYNFSINKNVNDTNSVNNDLIFNSLESDSYNLSLIYNYSNNIYNSIKIKHKSKQNKRNQITCVLGVLANVNGLQIEESMLDWLLQYYDVYSVYQKYPGIFYEYPALRFAQWFSLKYNKEIILYVHTKGAYYNNSFQHKVRDVWKHEFTEPYKNLYLELLKNNMSDISLPFKSSTCTWYNGMFISNRAFNLINEIPYYEGILRHYYECLTFRETKDKNTKIRIRGVIYNSIGDKQVLDITNILPHYFKTAEYLQNKNNKSALISENFILVFIFIMLLKIILKLKYIKIC